MQECPYDVEGLVYQSLSGISVTVFEAVEKIITHHPQPIKLNTGVCDVTRVVIEIPDLILPPAFGSRQSKVWIMYQSWPYLIEWNINNNVGIG